MIDLEKRKILTATVMLPLAFGIASCSLYWENEDKEEPAKEEVQKDVVVEVNETVTTGYVTTYSGSADRYSYNAPLDGGKFAEQVPYNALNERYGNAGEDLAATVPGAEGADIIVSDQHSADCVEEKFEILTDEEKKPEDDGKSAKKGGDAAAAAAGEDASVMANLRGAEDGRIEDAEPVEDWLAPEGASLRTLLMEWSDRSGWKVVWKSDREYILEAGAVFRGRYMDVTSALVRTFARARPAPIATFYKGNMVLLITTLEDENAD